MNQINLKTYPNIAQSWGIVGIMILLQIIAAPVIIFFPKLLGQDFSMLMYYLISVGGAFLIANAIRKSKTRKSHFSFQTNNESLLIYIIPAALALVVGIVSPIQSLMPMPESFRKIMMDMLGQTSGASFLMMVIAAPLLEELIFRGIILDGLLKKYSPIQAILFSSFLFGLVHLNPWQFVTGMVIGVFSGWVYYRTKSLTFSVLIHATVNLTGFIIQLVVSKDEMATDTSWSEMYGGMIYAILIVLSGILIAAFCVFQLYHKLEPVKEMFSEEDENELSEHHFSDVVE